MKRYIVTLVLFIQTLPCFSQVHVNGYYRKDGTYVQPHLRTYPNSTVTDNYSYPGNYNPNTGQTTGGGTSAGAATVVNTTPTEYYSTGDDYIVLLRPSLPQGYVKGLFGEPPRASGQPSRRESFLTLFYYPYHKIELNTPFTITNYYGEPAGYCTLSEAGVRMIYYADGTYAGSVTYPRKTRMRYEVRMGDQVRIRKQHLEGLWTSAILLGIVGIFVIASS